jgi:hypothetical protein
LVHWGKQIDGLIQVPWLKKTVLFGSWHRSRHWGSRLQGGNV